MSSAVSSPSSKEPPGESASSTPLGSHVGAAVYLAPYPVLYSFRRCPYAMRARLALLASGQVVELREVALADKPAALLQASPKATVPVLVLPDGQVIEQSLDIMLWALRQNDPQGWLPAPGAAWDTALQWITQCDGSFKQHLDRYKYPHRYAESEGLTDGLAHRALGGAYLAAVNGLLMQNTFLLGKQAGLADMAIAPFVRQFAHTDDAWFAAQPWGALHAWLAAFEGSVRFAQIMEKHAAWQPGAPPVLLGHR